MINTSTSYIRLELQKANQMGAIILFLLQLMLFTGTYLQDECYAQHAITSCILENQIGCLHRKECFWDNRYQMCLAPIDYITGRITEFDHNAV